MGVRLGAKVNEAVGVGESVGTRVAVALGAGVAVSMAGCVELGDGGGGGVAVWVKVASVAGITGLAVTPGLLPSGLLRGLQPVAKKMKITELIINQAVFLCIHQPG